MILNDVMKEWRPPCFYTETELRCTLNKVNADSNVPPASCLDSFLEPLNFPSGCFTPTEGSDLFLSRPDDALISHFHSKNNQWWKIFHWNEAPAGPEEPPPTFPVGPSPRHLHLLSGVAASAPPSAAPGGGDHGWCGVYRAAVQSP